MKDIVLMAPTIDDIETMWRWGEENWQLWGDEKNKWFSKKSLKGWIKNPKDDVLLIAKKGQLPIGMSMVASLRDWAFCLGLFVDEDYRGRGIGKNLLQESIKQLHKQGVENLTLLVDTKNQRAKKFYEREGFYEGFQFIMMNINIKKIKFPTRISIRRE